MIPDKNFLMEQYKQCHEHLRETDPKRDIIFGVYVTLSLAVYGLFARTNDSQVALLVGNIGLTIVGIFLGGLFTLYRGWHGIYIISATLLQESIRKNDIHVDNEFLKNIVFKFNNIWSVELLMFLFLNLIILFNYLLGFYSGYNYFLKIVIGIILSIQFVTHFCVMYYLDRQKISGKLMEFSWILKSTIEVKGIENKE